MDLLPIKRALLSVTDKGGLVDFAAFLSENGVALVSTGGTRALLRENGLAVTEVSEVTGFPEIMGGRVKTLHPAVHGGILADKDNPEHLRAIASHGIKPFDLVCVNLYNFAEAVKKGLDPRSAVEEIDIGGPCMLRASAKNFHSALALPSPSYYPRVMNALKENGMRAPLDLRRELAAATFAATSFYDGMIASYLSKKA
ncbi:MAG: IMP cyclohydrolase [Desulfovibrio sp.]|jgi:phosphoribosylaminoimidazolecarboxamide formyltransferase/IMP cyclohydrolase|nr:IMP cyclohydrolase [Desulfovibrio sp.]